MRCLQRLLDCPHWRRRVRLALPNLLSVLHGRLHTVGESDTDLSTLDSLLLYPAQHPGSAGIQRGLDLCRLSAAGFSGETNFRQTQNRNRRSRDCLADSLVLRSKPPGALDFLLSDGRGAVPAGSSLRAAKREMGMAERRRHRRDAGPSDLHLFDRTPAGNANGIWSADLRDELRALYRRAQNVGCVCRHSDSFVDIQVKPSGRADAKVLSDLVHQT